MTILEDLKSGLLVVVPREADLADYDAGLLNDWGGGNVDWWQDYLRAEIGRANDFWRSQVASPSHTAGLIALVEGMERERDEAQRLVNQLSDDITFLRKRRGDLVRDRDAAEARALAAEAERDALREALRSIEFQCETAVINLRQMPGDNKPASRAFLSLMNSARALTQEQPNVRE